MCLLYAGVLPPPSQKILSSNIILICKDLASCFSVATLSMAVLEAGGDCLTCEELHLLGDRASWTEARTQDSARRCSGIFLYIKGELGNARDSTWNSVPMSNLSRREGNRLG